MLASFPAILVSSHIRSSVFITCPLGISHYIYKILSPATIDSYFSLEIWVTGLFFFSCQIALARTSSQMLSSGDESGHPWLVLLLGKCSHLSLLSMMLAMGSSWMLIVMLTKFLWCLVCWKKIFLSWKDNVMNFVKCLPGSIEMVLWLSLLLLILCITSIVSHVEPLFPS